MSFAEHEHEGRYGGGQEAQPWLTSCYNFRYRGRVFVLMVAPILGGTREFYKDCSVLESSVLTLTSWPHTNLTSLEKRISPEILLCICRHLGECWNPATSMRSQIVQAGCRSVWSAASSGFSCTESSLSEVGELPQSSGSDLHGHSIKRGQNRGCFGMRSVI